MAIALPGPDELVKVCSETETLWGLEALQTTLKSLLPEYQFGHAMTRGNWHRLGGVVDNDYNPVSSNLAEWALEQAPRGDVDQLMVQYMDAGYFVTRQAGKTHYLTAPSGDNAEDFIQLEIEELQEVIERPLVEREWYPDTLEEFLDPLDYPRLEPEPVGKPHYQFRRITHIADLIGVESDERRSFSNLRRFLRDWRLSSTFETAPFCRHWILSLQEYRDSDGEQRINIRPSSTYPDALPGLPPGESLHGAELANAIHAYDRQLGYPFAWYFIMLSRKASNYDLAKAVLSDLMGAYDYLPARDLKVLRQWEERPYCV